MGSLLGAVSVLVLYWLDTFRIFTALGLLGGLSLLLFVSRPRPKTKRE
eukprot:NODE_10321_length_216_cov_62.922156_g9706_i0.p2 GENE.NODE_10321_length_216_cov_62.922156_g9706_i0~~NODE_10321_length_216_cov_62.922156_g9706_i0.p2  ORF type:complete len:58 (-),score=20.00 NODE_10321_length_216_cov_62.922156_g9706_i0:42-185(-)